MTNIDYPIEAPPVSTHIVAPTAEVLRGRWVDVSGNTVTQRGVRAFGVARQHFNASEAAAVVAGMTPCPKLAITILGYERTFLGADNIPDNSFVTCAADGTTIVASQANDEILGFLPRGGNNGNERGVFVFRNSDERISAAAIADLVHAVGVADGTIDDVGGAFDQTTLNNNFKELSTKVNLIFAALRNQKVIAP
jgi:hypothetical protein